MLSTSLSCPESGSADIAMEQTVRSYSPHVSPEATPLVSSLDLSFPSPQVTNATEILVSQNSQSAGPSEPIPSDKQAVLQRSTELQAVRSSLTELIPVVLHYSKIQPRSPPFPACPLVLRLYLRPQTTVDCHLPHDQSAITLESRPRTTLNQNTRAN